MAFTLTAGYTWVDGEVFTATKANLAAVPTLATNQSYTFSNGAAATPSINFNGSSTTGLFYSATGVGVSAAATQYAFFDANGLHLGNTFATSISSQLNIFHTSANSSLCVGQDSTHNLNFFWNYNATAGSAFAKISTFSQTNDLYIQANAINFDTTSLAFAVQMFAAGRVKVGGGSDDGSNALQSTTFATTGAATVGTVLTVTTRYQCTPATLTYGASTALDFAVSDTQTVTLTGNITFTTSNLAAGRGKVVRIIGDGSVRTFTFPAGWTFMNNAAPASIAANKTAMLSLLSFSTTDANVVASYIVQP